jgi:hypothetical protein
MQEAPLIALSPLVGFKLFVLVVLYLFVPLSALTYYFTRRKRRIIDNDRILSLLNIDAAYRKAYEPDGLTSYVWAIVYLSIVSAIGLVLLLFSREIGLVNGEFPIVSIGEVEFPQHGSRLVFAMAFLGVYLSVLQHLYRRYATTDLPPTIYYGSSIRIIMAAVVALVIYNAYSALSGGSDSDSGITSTIWPALAFLIGVFPQRGLRWLTDRVPMLSGQGDALVRSVPLEMIEGVESHDVLRLEELGIDSCYDLATVDFVPLLLKTPYSARQLIDWILQAKLCVHFGDTTKDLRQKGIRTIVDLEVLSPEEIEALPAETSVTAPVLLRAHQAVKDSVEIQRLREVGRLLGVYWNRELGAASGAVATGTTGVEEARAGAGVRDQG